ncbi:MAG: GH92 family glycosyl hydrolase, partial [Myxococcota bacterium]
GVQLLPRGGGWDDAFTTPIGRSAPFDHAREWAGPGWYAVDLTDDGTAVQIAATRRGALHRYTFAPGATPVVVLDLGFTLSGVEIGDDSSITFDPAASELAGFQRLIGGYSGRFGGLQTWFVASFDPPPTGGGAWSDPGAPDAAARVGAGAAAGAWVSFPPGTAEVTVRVALSTVDLEGARANLAAELPPSLGVGEPAFAAVRDAARAEWAAELDQVRLFGGIPDEDTVRTVFHTAQYHTMMMPRTFSDVDGRYRGIDGEVHPDAPEGYVTDLSLWDTFRTTHPWLLLTQPERQREVLRSLVRMTVDGGATPRWPLGHGYTGGMIGSPGTIVFADAALKGLGEGWDQDVAFEASVAQATGPTPPESRGGIEDWTTIGYVSSTYGAGASLTLEYAWADAALARWADARGDTEAAAVAWDGAGRWRNTWDPATRFFRARAPDGTFAEFDGELVWSSDYVEGNAWHYRWTVPHDVDGMIELQNGGDRAAFLTELAAYWDRVYAEPDDAWPDDWYWHGNEPVLHYAWLGSLAGAPELTAEASRWVATHRYAADPVGLDGNDDAGTLSAWYLWAAIGLYPVAGTDLYAVGAPLVDRAEIDTEWGRITIEGSGEALPATIELDGAPLGGTVTHDQLLGGTLTFDGHARSDRAW